MIAVRDENGILMALVPRYMLEYKEDIIKRKPYAKKEMTNKRCNYLFKSFHHGDITGVEVMRQMTELDSYYS